MSSSHVELICEWCGKEYQRRENQADSSRFCSRKCQGKWYSENRSGENSPHWDGGPDDPREAVDWPEIRNEVLERDNHTCQSCEKVIQSAPHVHHNIPVSAGGGNDLDNLVALCQECHSLEHINRVGWSLLTDRERKILQTDGEDVTEKYYDLVVSRVRNKIELIDDDVEALEQHETLAQELRERVCDSDEHTK